MSRIKKEEVRDGYFGDLSPDLQRKLMEVHKIIVDNCNATFKEKNYSSINTTPWAKQMLSEFVTAPKDKFHVGSVRVYKSGKRYRCMIQITGHCNNNRNSIDEELFHDFIRNVHQDIRALIKRKYNFHLTCESEHGEHFEGFDVWLSKKDAEEVWNAFADMKTKKLKDYEEAVIDKEYLFADILEMPKLLVEDAFDYIKLANPTLEAADCSLEIFRNRDQYSGRIYVDKGPEAITEVADTYELNHPCIYVESPTSLVLDPSFAEKLFLELEKYDDSTHYSWNTLEDTDNIEEASHSGLNYDFRIGFDYNTGHQIKIVYDLDGAEITNVGKFYSDRHAGDKTSEQANKDYLQHVKQNIKYKGNTDHESKGQKVLAIVDVVTNKRLNEVNLINPLTGGLDPYALAQDEDKLNYVKDIMSKRGKSPIHLVVGEIDDTPSYKSTFWAPGLKGDHSRWQHIQNLENLADVRGWKGKNVFSVRGYDKPVFNKLVMKNPNKKQAEAELEARKDYAGLQLSNLEKNSKDFEKDPRYQRLKHDYDQIQQDLKTVREGEYSPRIMDKYHSKQISFDNPVKECWLSDDQLINFFSYYENMMMLDDDVDDYINEAADSEVLTVTEAKRTLAVLSQSIINDCKNDRYKVTQYTADIYANVITKNLLPKWAPEYNKFHIILDSYQSFNTLEFKTPAMTQDFISRFIDGRETINGFLHRSPEIKIKMSPRIFHTMKDKDDAFLFFKSAILYYENSVERYAERVLREVHKMNAEMKHLAKTTKLSGLVSMPLQMLFTFENVDMTDRTTFTINQDDILAVNTFIKGIYSNYAAPEKEKKEILDGLKKVIDSFNEAYNDDQFRYLLTEVGRFYEGVYDDSIERFKDRFISENVDVSWNHHIDPQIRALQEKTKVKKLKKIPADLVAYITIEAECIKDANDKMMIASYCISKIEIVEWYIELLEVGSNKYIVPHTLPYLQNLRTQLLACYKKIMDVKIINPNERPIIDIKYPKGFEG